MAEVAYPAANTLAVIGKPIDREDGPAKATGAAQYAYDVNRPNMLFAKVLGAKPAHARVVRIDTAPAAALPGVEAVWHDEQLAGGEVVYSGQVIAAVAAVTEEIAQEAVRAIQVEYEVLPHEWEDANPAKVSDRDPNIDETRSDESRDIEAALSGCDVVSEGEYGCPTITHCCLEAHGHVAEFRGEELYIWASTQNVSRYTATFTEKGGVPDANIQVDCQYMGGGFGSKFGADKWGDICNYLAHQSGKPVKLMLERDVELMAAGNRPSSYANIRVGAGQDGKVKALDAEVWGTHGVARFSAPPIPYVLTRIPDYRVITREVETHRAPPRAWRAPRHPQGCLLTMTALDDCAAALGMDALEFFKLNADLTDRPEVYREELDIAAEMIGYHQKAHPRGDSTPGPIKRGLGIALHTWGGRGHQAECEIVIHPDGSVEARIGSQDLGVGTRTIIGQVTAETLGIPYEQVLVRIGRNAYPAAGSSGGSTTSGGVSGASRIAATNARNDFLAMVSDKTGIPAERLEIHNGEVRETGNPSNSMSWERACRLLGHAPLRATGVNNPAESVQMGLIDAGVGGVQIAEVSVDMETGIARIEEMVAVQDCGLILNMKTATSQVYGGMIMGITYSLYEEAVFDPVTGRMLNPNMEFYKLAGIADVGKLKVHMMTDDKYQRRGVIGLGEPPVIGPGAAISNAVANAIGVRVPHLPLTPDRVLQALSQKGAVA